MDHKKITKLVQTAVFSAIIILLAFVPYIGYIKVPILAIQATTVHIPVIVGSILLGPKYGAFLGFIFGCTSLINNTMQPGITSFCFSPFIQIAEGLGGSPLALFVCFIPRILCGVFPFYCYTFMQSHAKVPKKRKKFSLLLSGVVGSLTNTILVMSMIYIFFGHAYAAARSIPYEAIFGVILSVVFINGTIEAVVAAILSSTVCSALQTTKFFK